MRVIPLKTIAHRVNWRSSIDYYLQNHPELDIETDVWKINDQLFLGHDGPEEKVTYSWLAERASKLWLHAKNFGALSTLHNLNTFFHKNDDFTVTTKGYTWKYPEVYFRDNLVAVCVDNPIVFDRSYNGSV